MDTIKSTIRVAVAYFVGAFFALLANNQIPVESDDLNALVAALTQVITGVLYYFIARAIEKAFPNFRMLGFKKPGDIK